jgi:hypothetical protein
METKTPAQRMTNHVLKNMPPPVPQGSLRSGQIIRGQGSAVCAEPECGKRISGNKIRCAEHGLKELAEDTNMATLGIRIQRFYEMEQEILARRKQV